MAAFLMRFTDPANDATERLNISTRLDPGAPLDFGNPDIVRDIRAIRIPLLVKGSTKDAAITAWNDIIKELERCSTLEIRLTDATSSIWFDSYLIEHDRETAPQELRSQIAFDYSYPFDLRHVMKGTVIFVARAYGRGAEQTPVNAVSIANAPQASNFVDIASPLGDVEAPAKIEITSASGTAPNRWIARLYRRTRGDVTKFISIYEPESTAPTADYTRQYDDSGETADSSNAARSNGASALTTPTDTTLKQRFTFKPVNSRVADNMDGILQVYLKVADGESVQGRLKAKIRLTEGDVGPGAGGSLLIDSDTVTINADADHDQNAAFELWPIGVFEMRKLAALHGSYRPAWQVSLQRTTGSSSFHTDYMAVFPVDESVVVADYKPVRDQGDSNPKSLVIDTSARAAWYGTLSAFSSYASFGGRGMWLKPGVTNRILMQSAYCTGHTTTLDDPPHIELESSSTITIKYTPRYLHVR